MSTMDEPTRRLREAILARNEAEVRKALEDGADQSWQDETTGESMLMTASALGLADSVSALLAAGAPWNALDRNGRCAGDYALASGHQVIVDALVTAGVTAELIFGEMSKSEYAAAPRNLDYLQGKAAYEGDLFHAETKDAVMMEWERPLMQAHASVLFSQGARTVLNIGFGMGIIDEYFQSFGPARHVISEAHPDVLNEMNRRGWMNKPNVVVVNGRWQERIDDIVNLGPYDAVFFDTFGEHLDDLREFHQQLPRLLSQNGLYSFFNGMCPNNFFFQGVACEVVRLDLQNLGLDCEFHRMEVDPGNDEVWANVARRYFNSTDYYLPLAKRSATQDTTPHRRDLKRVVESEREDAKRG